MGKAPYVAKRIAIRCQSAERIGRLMNMPLCNPPYEPPLPVPKPAVVITEDDFVYVPIDQLDNPGKGGSMNVIRDSWWVVHPTKGLAFYNPKRKNGKRGSGHGNPYGAPQCNRSKAITDGISQKWMEVKFIEIVFLPLIIGDYM